jgi:RNA polymerase sigma-70 factor (ECF subfamily)
MTKAWRRSPLPVDPGSVKAATPEESESGGLDGRVPPVTGPETATKSAWHSDMRICDALTSGEAWAATALYDRVCGVVNNVLYRILRRDDNEREDLAQQAFERIISTIISGRFARDCNLLTWSAVITHHIALDAFRKRRQERSLFGPEVEGMDPDLAVSPMSTPDMAVAARRQLEMVLIALKSVQKARAETFMLHDLLGLGLVEIAKITGVSVAAAQSRLVRGRREVLEHVQAQERGAR